MFTESLYKESWNMRKQWNYKTGGSSCECPFATTHPRCKMNKTTRKFIHLKFKHCTSTWAGHTGRPDRLQPWILGIVFGSAVPTLAEPSYMVNLSLLLYKLCVRPLPSNGFPFSLPLSFAFYYSSLSTDTSLFVTNEI